MKYSYRAKNLKGEEKAGIIEAQDRETVVQMLQKDSLFVVNIQEEKKEKFTQIFNFQKVTLKDKIIFSQQLAVLFKSGIPLLRALKTIQNQTENKKFAGVIGELIGDIEAGQSFSESLANHPNVFPDLYIQVVKSGEKSGNLDKILLKLAKDLERNYDIITQVRSALVYPIFICSALIVLVIGVLVFIIPQLSKLFAESNVKLPLPTRILLGISNGVVHMWWLIPIIVIIIYITIKVMLRSEKGRLLYDGFLLKLPIVSNLLKDIYLGRFARTLSTLVSAGLPILEAFDTLKDVIGNAVYKKEISQARKKIETGVPIGESLEESDLFPSMTVQMISIGEQAGNMSYTLENLARFYEKESQTTSKKMSTLLEPVLMILMGAGVAFFAIAVIMPIYNLVQVIK